MSLIIEVTEKEIRARIKASALRFARRFNEHPVSIVEELEVNGGRARIDIAFLGEHFIGIEIKSPKDTLDRLERQSNHYAPYFDYLVLVTDSKMVETAMEILPEHWGITVALRSDSTVSLSQLRQPLLNPERDAVNLLKLLWKDELISLLGEEEDNSRWIRASKEKIRNHIITTVDHKLIHNTCLKYLTNRNDWRIKRLHTSISK